MQKNKRTKAVKPTKNTKKVYNEGKTPRITRFPYFSSEESEQFAFYKVPKCLVTDDRFKRLSGEAKLAYGLMLDRASLSEKNNWVDKSGRVYIIFTLEEMAERLNCGIDKCVKVFAELDSKNENALIERKKMGMGQPAHIYVKDFTRYRQNSYGEDDSQGSGLPFIMSGESERYQFYRIPKRLVTDDCFNDLSVDAKLAYGLLLDRMELSKKNGWVDEQDHVYVYYKREEFMEDLNCKKDKVTRLISELDQENGIGLIERKKIGMATPMRIYIKNFISESVYDPDGEESLKHDKDTDDIATQRAQNQKPIGRESRSLLGGKSEVYKTENQKSIGRKCRSQLGAKTEGIKTEKNKTEINKTESINLSGKGDIVKKVTSHSDGRDCKSRRENLIQYSDKDIFEGAGCYEREFFKNDVFKESHSLKDDPFGMVVPKEHIPDEKDFFKGNACKRNFSPETDLSKGISAKTDACEKIHPREDTCPREDIVNVYRDVVKENICYWALENDCSAEDLGYIDDLVDIMSETLALGKGGVKVGGNLLPYHYVKCKLLKVTHEHILYILACLHSHTGEIHNIRSYLLTCLFNAPSTMNSYYSAKVNSSLGL